MGECVGRLRSTDPGMRLRMRLATNPGNVGHATHKATTMACGLQLSKY